jgi:hypothetical protein
MIDQPLENNIPDEASINPCLVSLQMQLDAANSKIAELEEREGLLKKLLYCCDGLSTEYAQNNHGRVKEWLRHVDTAYQALKEQGE